MFTGLEHLQNTYNTSRTPISPEFCVFWRCADGCTLEIRLGCYFICILRGYKVIQCSDNIDSDYIFIDSINRRAVIQ
jgi:hypothetical protein